MPLRTLAASKAGDLDKELMETHKFSLDQLMELAGLAVAQALYALHPPTSPSAYPTVLIICGPGNNGGDGLVAARHLAHFGYIPMIHYPKQSNNELYTRLVSQLKGLGISFIKELNTEGIDFIIDAIFGFSFKGEVREPFPDIIKCLEETKIPVLAVDVPSSWDVECGPPNEGVGSQYMPSALISLTAPKPCVKFFKGRHFVGGRFLSRDVADRFGIDVPDYKGTDQILEVEGADAKL